ncbi:hypothetical protein MMC30_007238 [Trapelia coarctata]|nr:hypothetical protein [Trapelia coarctata]
MKPPFPSLTAEWHNATYAAIDPTRPALSAAAKTVVVTGAGSGIGRETIRAYAAAGASQFALLGRTLATLSETKGIVETEFPAVHVTTYVVDTADEAAVQQAAEDVGKWDILILNAAAITKPTSIAQANVNDWWRVFETNVKGSMIPVHAFLPNRNSNAAIVGVNAAMVTIPAPHLVSRGASAYVSSKMAQLKFLELLAAENPDIFVVSVHPGVVRTPLLDKANIFDAPEDDVRLPADFMVWVTSPEAQFLRGKFVYANWDVDQLKARAKEIEATPMLTSNVLGWPFEPA